VSRSSNNQVHSTATTTGLLAEEIPSEFFVENGIFSRAEWEELSEKLGLSPRQAQVASLLMRGLADKQIAMNLDISTHTLRTYLDRMFTKMQVSDRCELIVHIFREFRTNCNGCCPRIQ
jgi:DNA-binding NarL/FixJ family response regulator